jgi:hypothetical protein
MMDPNRIEKIPLKDLKTEEGADELAVRDDAPLMSDWPRRC